VHDRPNVTLIHSETPMAKAMATLQQWHACCGAVITLLEDVPMDWSHAPSILLHKTMTAALVARLDWNSIRGQVLLMVALHEVNE
jgi:hypothetical protein